MLIVIFKILDFNPFSKILLLAFSIFEVNFRDLFFHVDRFFRHVWSIVVLLSGFAFRVIVEFLRDVFSAKWFPSFLVFLKCLLLIGCRWFILRALYGTKRVKTVLFILGFAFACRSPLFDGIIRDPTRVCAIQFDLQIIHLISWINHHINLMVIKSTQLNFDIKWIIIQWYSSVWICFF